VECGRTGWGGGTLAALQRRECSGGVVPCDRKHANPSLAAPTEALAPGSTGFIIAKAPRKVQLDTHHGGSLPRLGTRDVAARTLSPPDLPQTRSIPAVHQCRANTAGSVQARKPHTPTTPATDTYHQEVWPSCTLWLTVAHLPGLSTARGSLVHQECAL